MSQNDTFKKDWRDILADNPVIILLVIVVLAFAGFAGWKQYKEHERAEARIAREEREEYDRIARAADAAKKADLAGTYAVIAPPKTLPSMGTAPPIPPLPPAALPDGTPNVRERLRYLVQANPIAHVRTDMDAAITSGDLLLYANTDVGLLASFAYVPRFLLTKVEKDIGTALAVPVFGFDPKLVGGMSTEADAYMGMLVVAHEFRHYLDFVKADDTGKLDFLMKKEGVKTSEHVCAQMWRSEWDAYHEECGYALEWGMPTVVNGDLCLHYENLDDGFDRYMFVMLSSGVTGQHSPECIPTWARLAGHPHWRAYL